MKTGGRLQAAIEVLDDVEARRRPVADALKDWGLSHRFAGSGDRTAIGSLVYDALRRKASNAWVMDTPSARAAVLVTFADAWGQGLDALALALGDPHAPAPLTAAERARLGENREALLADAPAHVRADCPEWLMPSLAGVYGEGLERELQALCDRAPVDLRVNTLMATREAVLAELAGLGARPTPLAPHGLRLPDVAPTARPPHVPSEAAYQEGRVEIQDEGSQLAALIAGARSGENVLDLCAGGGGKSLAMAADLAGRGRIFAYDSDKRRFGDFRDRVRRAGADTVELRAPGVADSLADLEEGMDLVLVDAPCTGTGTWRRRPDAKWRLRPNALDARMRDQDLVLDEAMRFVAPHGRVVYVTCSILAEENEDRVAAALERHPGRRLADPLARLDPATAARLAPFVRTWGHGTPALRLTPAGAGTDGFFVAVLEADR
ncbi:RsmB/NOP family class I SAM-dependent RNA methyltransferase [Siculibacillus lacustris]|uniref:RsmB/NOP family class I SAM-dependent RNA methyltransferase n=1 Tax=Siculibacillus lacustris TaxID=1549641 RepID=A0A4Q9VUG7_9HYPH|nr:RsmB/NOP family class I SAM-dependent RNA methyltransferase [Siculibacillus lacustris]TBW39822.1 RsmB/NOP family class I SAM-dependent RNA methyltransferase [Siculibacillus lacustris]